MQGCRCGPNGNPASSQGLVDLSPCDGDVTCQRSVCMVIGLRHLWRSTRCGSPSPVTAFETLNIRSAGAGDPHLGRRETVLGVKPSAVVDDLGRSADVRAGCNLPPEPDS